MGMPEKPQNGMNIAPDGTVYEILDDGTIKRIGKVSSDGRFEPFGGLEDGIVVKNGIIYRVINGKKQKIGRVLPNGDIESISQKIKSETEISGNKVKIVAILSVLIALIIGAGIYVFKEKQEAEERRANEAKIAEEERMKDEEYENKIKPVIDEYLQETSPKADKLNFYIEKLKLLQLSLKYEENKKKADEIISNIKSRKADVETKTAAEAQKANAAAAQAKAEADKANAEAKTQAVAARKPGGTKIGNLEWSKRSSKEMKWSSAKQYCKNLSEGGFDDWRLPTISELKTTIKNCPSGGSSCKVSDSCLADSCMSDSCLCDSRKNNGGYYSKLGDGFRVYLWSSSTRSDNTNFAWGVNCLYGRVYNYDKSYDLYVRCVR